MTAPDAVNPKRERACLLLALLVAGLTCACSCMAICAVGGLFAGRLMALTPLASLAIDRPAAVVGGSVTPWAPDSGEATVEPAQTAPSGNGPTVRPEGSPRATDRAALPERASASPIPRRGGTLRLPGGTPTTLDPVQVRDVASAVYVYEIFSGLVTLSPGLEVVPDLAASWEVSPSGEVYTFTLRSGIAFQDGRSIRVEDVVFAIERACDPRTASPAAATYLNDIIGCSAKLAGKASSVAGLRQIDERRLAIAIDGPKRYFLAKLTNPTSFVVDRRQVEEPDWWRQPNGSGPFRLRQYVPDEKLVLERNDRYHGQRPYLDRVVFDLRPITTATLYENGELDAMPVGAEDRERLSDPLNPLSAQLVDGPPEMGLMYIGFQVRTPPFDDRHVRRAISCALDKERLAGVVLRGGVQPAYWILPPAMPGHNPEVRSCRYDLQAARRELAASRYGSASALPPLVLHASGEGGGDPVVLAIAELLRDALGVTISVEQAPWELFQLEVEAGAYGMYVLGWSADYPDPQDFLDVLFHSQSPLNHTGYADEQVDAWLVAARTEADEQTRLTLYRQSEQKILDDAAWLPLYSGFESWLVAPQVRGFELAPLVMPRLGRVWLAEDAAPHRLGLSFPTVSISQGRLTAQRPGS